MRSLWTALAAIVVAALLASSCTSDLTRPSPTDPPLAPTSTNALVVALREQGATVNPGEVVPLALPCTSVPGQLVSVNRGTITVFEYPTVAAAESDAAKIRADGSGVMGDSCAAMITWAGPPRFYKSGNLIVLYVGRDETVLRPLEAVVGKPFAGR
jgi:hypothetical protein